MQSPHHFLIITNLGLKCKSEVVSEEVSYLFIQYCQATRPKQVIVTYKTSYFKIKKINTQDFLEVRILIKKINKKCFSCSFKNKEFHDDKDANDII